jgi:hypothetical protein
VGSYAGIEEEEYMQAIPYMIVSCDGSPLFDYCPWIVTVANCNTSQNEVV